MNKKTIKSLIILLISLFVLQACSSKPEKNINNIPKTTPIPKKTTTETKKQAGMIESMANYYSPKKNFNKANNAKRKTEIATLLSSFTYAKAMGPAECNKGGTSEKVKIPNCDNLKLNGSPFDGAYELGTNTGTLDCSKALSSMITTMPVNPGPGNTAGNTGYYVCQSKNRTYILVGGGIIDETGGCYYPGNPKNYPEGTTKEDRVMCVSG